ncbi:MAG: LysR family transcriptional regulator [Phycisphaerae bacterium]|nr:LysR family transcriptional regulator [Phycisphaerae bacterium]
MNIPAFKLFCDVVRCRSFSRAAAMNGISQSAASQSVSCLERELGVQLIDRQRRPIILTHEGEICYQGLCEILRQFEFMKAGMEASRHLVQGTVRVAAIYSVGLYDMNWAMQKFMADYPMANIRLEYHLPDKVYEAVQSNEADLGILSYPVESRDLNVIPLRQEEMVLVCHPDHHLATRQVVQPSQLNGEDFVSFDRELTISRELDRYFRQNHISVRKVMVFDNVETIKQAVELGVGLSILPEPTIRHEVKVGSLVALRLAGCDLKRPIGIIHLHQKVFTPALVKFVEILGGKRDAEEAASAETGSSPRSRK